MPEEEGLVRVDVMTFNTPYVWRKALAALGVFMFSLIAHAESRVVAYVPNWVDLNTFSETIEYGKITHIKFWKAPGEPSGNHVGRIWTASGGLLATASFTSETSSGWQTAAVVPALSISANTRYKVSYNVHSVVAKTFNVFANGPLNRPPFTIYGSSFCSPAGCFPTTGSTSNLFPDIVFNSPQ